MLQSMYSACSASVQVWAHTAPLGQLTFIAFIMMPTIHVIVRDLDSLEFSSFIMFMVPLNKINILCGLKCISLLLFIFLPILVNTCSTLNLISIFPSLCADLAAQVPKNGNKLYHFCDIY